MQIKVQLNALLLLCQMLQIVLLAFEPFQVPGSDFAGTGPRWNKHTPKWVPRDRIKPTSFAF